MQRKRLQLDNADLEDDTLSLVEPRLHNSGLDQGILVKRHRIPKNDLFTVRV